MLDFEDISRKNLIYMYHQELVAMYRGAKAGDLFMTRGEKRHLSKNGVLEKVSASNGMCLAPTSDTVKYLRECGYL